MDLEFIKNANREQLLAKKRMVETNLNNLNNKKAKTESLIKEQERLGSIIDTRLNEINFVSEVSDHTIVRYAERVQGMNLSKHREMLSCDTGQYGNIDHLLAEYLSKFVLNANNIKQSLLKKCENIDTPEAKVKFNIGSSTYILVVKDFKVVTLYRKD